MSVVELDSGEPDGSDGDTGQDEGEAVRRAHVTLGIWWAVEDSNL